MSSLKEVWKQSKQEMLEQSTVEIITIKNTIKGVINEKIRFTGFNLTLLPTDSEEGFQEWGTVIFQRIMQELSLKLERQGCLR